MPPEPRKSRSTQSTKKKSWLPTARLSFLGMRTRVVHHLTDFFKRIKRLGRQITTLPLRSTAGALFLIGVGIAMEQLSQSAHSRALVQWGFCAAYLFLVIGFVWLLLLWTRSSFLEKLNRNENPWDNQSNKPYLFWKWTVNTGIIALFLFAISVTAFFHVDKLSSFPARKAEPQEIPFSLKAKAAYVNLAPTTNGTIFWLTYRASGVDWRSPIATVVYVSITNMQSVPSLVERITVQTKTETCDWFDLVPMDARAGKFSVSMDEALHRAVVIDLHQNSLSYNLQDHPIPPHESVGGWMLFDTTRECQTFTDELVELKFSVTDSTGLSFTAVISKNLSPDDLHPNRLNSDFQNPTFIVTKESVDINSYRLQRYADKRGLLVIPNGAK